MTRASRRVRLARFPPSRESNPYLRLLYGELRRFGVDLVAEPSFSVSWLLRARGKVEILHFHWSPDRYYALRRSNAYLDRPPPRFQGLRSWLKLGAFTVRIAAARRLGYRLVWTVHEVYPTESTTRPPGAISHRIDELGSRLLAHSCDLVLAHDAATGEAARAEFGLDADRIEIVPHGSYVGVYPPGRPRAEVRRELGIPETAFTFICFGSLRPDKQIDLVLDAFCSIDEAALALVIAGEVEDPRPGRRVRAAAGDRRIRLLLEFVPEERVRELFDAVDAAVLGRSEVWTSGSLILALSMGVPVVAASVPPYDDLVGDGAAGWRFQPGDVDSLRAALRAAASDPALAREKRAGALRRAEAMPSWSEIAARTASLMLALGD